MEDVMAGSPSCSAGWGKQCFSQAKGNVEKERLQRTREMEGGRTYGGHQVMCSQWET